MTAYVINDWPSTRAEIKEIQLNWPFYDYKGLIDDIVMKDRRVVIPASLQHRTLQHLYSIYMGIERMRLLVRESVYLVTSNADIENAIKIAQHVLNSGHTARR